MRLGFKECDKLSSVCRGFSRKSLIGIVQTCSLCCSMGLWCRVFRRAVMCTGHNIGYTRRRQLDPIEDVPPLRWRCFILIDTLRDIHSAKCITVTESKNWDRLLLDRFQSTPTNYWVNSYRVGCQLIKRNKNVQILYIFYFICSI